METQTNVEPQQPVAQPEDKLSKIHLPKPQNSTQANRLAKLLFGPLARIVQDAGFVRVFVEKGGEKQLLAVGSDYHEALCKAVYNVGEVEKAGKSFEFILRVPQALNIIEDKRRTLAVKVQAEWETLAALHPNEVIEVFDLVQIRAMDETKSIIEKARLRAEERAKEAARLKKEADELEVKIKAAIAAKEGGTVGSQPAVEVSK